MKKHALSPAPTRRRFLLQSTLGLAAFSALTFVSPTAKADALDSALASGQLGEKRNGYLGLVDGSAPAGVRQLMDRINGQRRQAYQGIARKNGTTLAAVEGLAGARAIRNAPAGTFVENASGGWTKK